MNYKSFFLTYADLYKFKIVFNSFSDIGILIMQKYMMCIPLNRESLFISERD